MNENIIIEFKKLYAFMKNNIDASNVFRLKSIKTVISILNKIQYKLTLNNLNEFKELPNIGKGTIDRISEILTYGYLSEIKESINVQTNDLEQIIGIGKAKINELEKLGIKSVKEYIQYIKDNPTNIKVSHTIEMGLKYHKKYKMNIPRSEISSIYEFIKKVLDKKYTFEFCGSYRRQKNTSNDIDILITSKDTGNLNNIIESLKEKNQYNNNKPFLIDSLGINNKIKYMGFCKYKNNPIRRIDIRYIDYKSFYSALLYFTGPAELNQTMRLNAKKMGYKLSEYGLSKNNKIMYFSSEKEIFDILNMEYLEPQNR